MSSQQDLDKLTKHAGVAFTRLIKGCSNAMAGKREVNAEVQFMQLMRGRLTADAPNLDFLGAGRTRYYSPAQIERAARRWVGDVDVHVTARVARAIAKLCGLPNVAIGANSSLEIMLALLPQRRTLGVEDSSTSRRVLIASSLSPLLRHSLVARLKANAIDTLVVGFNPATGRIDEECLDGLDPHDFAAVIIGWPNFFGLFEDASCIAHWARDANTALLGWVTPHVLTWTKAPAQVLPGVFSALVGDIDLPGVSIQGGGAFGFCASEDKKLADRVRQARNVPLKGPQLAAAQAALVDCAPTIAQGGLQGRQKLASLVNMLCENDRVELAFDDSFVSEAVIRVNGIDLQKGLHMLGGHYIVAGYPLAEDYPELADCLLVHCNDRHRDSDLERLRNRFAAMIKTLSTAPCPVKPKFT
jgi:glycine dehydrogenase subunit 1